MTRPSPLFVSLGLNLALAVGLAWLALHRSPTPFPASSRPPAPPIAQPMKPALAPIDPTSNASDATGWIPQLRAAGIPENVLTQLVVANFATTWERRRKEMEVRWSRGELDDDAWAKFNRAHDGEEENALRAALGDAAFKAWDENKLLGELPLDRIPLSADECDALYALRRDLLTQRRNLDQQRRAGEIDDAQISELQDKLEANYAAKAKALLGDDRYATLERPTDSTIGALRRHLQTLNASDGQIGAVVAAEQLWRDQRAAADRTAAQNEQLTPEAYQAQLKSIDDARDAALQRELGADGVEALRQLDDERYRKLTRYAQLWQLSPGEVDQVYGALRTYTQTVEQYQQQAQSRGVDPNTAQEAIDRFRQTTANSLRSALGDEKFRKLAASEVLDFDR